MLLVRARSGGQSVHNSRYCALARPTNQLRASATACPISSNYSSSAKARTEVRHTWQPLERAPTGSMDPTGPVPNTLTGAASSASSRASPWWCLGAATAAYRAQQLSSLVCCSNSSTCPTQAFSTQAATHLKLRRPLIPKCGRFCMQQADCSLEWGGLSGASQGRWHG